MGIIKANLEFHFYSNSNNLFNVPIGGKIPDVDHVYMIEEDVQWSKGLAVSALQYTGE